MNKKEYFNDLANKWDEITEHNKEKIKNIIKLVNLYSGAKVLDVGSGTGVLIPFIIPEIGSNGKLICLDISENMLYKARKKFSKAIYPNIDFICNDILNYETDDKFDFIICYSSFPHFADKEESIKIMASLLLKGGKLIIAHSQSRKDINNFHKNLESPVSNDFLPTADELAFIFKKFFLKPILSIDNDEKFLVVGEK